MRLFVRLSLFVLVVALAVAFAGPAAGTSPNAKRGASTASASWSLAKIGLPAAWQLAKGGRRVLVAVVDSGVDPGARGLRGALVPGHDFVAGGESTADDFDHGTAVAGVVAGRPTPDTPGGACPRCLVMPIRVIDAGGHAQPAAVAGGIRWAVDHGAEVVNLSLVMAGPDPDVASAVRYALAHKVALVAGAGNFGLSSPGWPAAYPGVIGVAATDRRDALEPWSSFGNWVALAAPGCSVTDAAAAAIVRFCGTSSATALVSGVLALALSIRPAGETGDLGGALTSTAVPVGSFVDWGRIDAARLLQTLARTRIGS